MSRTINSNIDDDGDDDGATYVYKYVCVWIYMNKNESGARAHTSHHIAQWEEHIKRDELAWQASGKEKESKRTYKNHRDVIIKTAGGIAEEVLLASNEISNCVLECFKLTAFKQYRLYRNE